MASDVQVYASDVCVYETVNGMYVLVLYRFGRVDHKHTQLLHDVNNLTHGKLLDQHGQANHEQNHG